MTFSIVGRCAQTGMLGVAITTSSICVGSRCPWGRARVGAVATQNITDPGLGPTILDLLAAGRSACEAVDHAVSTASNIEYRQLTVIDASGQTAYYTGAKILGANAVAKGKGCVAAGNLLRDRRVPSAMTRMFEENPDTHLAERLLRALEAGLQAGGEAGPVRSAGLLVYHEQPWALVDLRIDWDEDFPIQSLRKVWETYEPQINDYVVRATDPGLAPSFSVPGDP
ncbi:MAG: DUF1028 domain-containing protein [Acidiferrobacterales bacterium]